MRSINFLLTYLLTDANVYVTGSVGLSGRMTARRSPFPTRLLLLCIMFYRCVLLDSELSMIETKY